MPGKTPRVHFGLLHVLICAAVLIGLLGPFSPIVSGHQAADEPTATATLEPPPPTLTPTLEPPTPTPEPPPTQTPEPAPTVQLPTPTPTISPTEESTSTPEPTQTSTPTPTPAVWQPFADDFEDGDLRHWDRVDGMFVQADQVLDGTYSARATSDGTHPAYARAELSLPQHDLYVRVRFAVVSRGANPVYLFRLRDADNRSILGLYVASDGDLTLRNDVTDERPASQIQIEDGIWHELRLHVRIDPNGGPGETEVWLNGALVDELSGATPLGSSAIAQFELSDNSDDRIFDVAFDGVLVDTTSIPADPRFKPIITNVEPEPEPALVAAATETSTPAGPAVTSLILVNADTDQDIRPLTSGETINLTNEPTHNLNVRAVTNPATVGSVRFAYDSNPNFRTENGAPYALAGDTSGNYDPWTPTAGSHTLTATPYSQANAGGTPGTALTITFTVEGAGTATPTPTATPEAFLEQDGLVVVEGEHFHGHTARGGKAWELRTNQSGFAADGFMSALPDTGALINSGYVTTSPELRFEVEFATAGTYHVWARAFADDDDNNSIHVGRNGQAQAGSDRLTTSTYGSWSWSKATIDGPVATLSVPSPGRYTINVWMREDGFRLDRLLLTTDGGFVPSGTGPAESPRSGGSTTPTPSGSTTPTSTPTPTGTPTPTATAGATGQWQTLASSGTNRQEVSYVTVGGKFYLAGGSNTSGATNLHQVYDPATNSWSTIAPLPANLDHIQAVALNGLIYYIGGLSSWPSPHVTTVYIYNPATNQFSQGTSMPSGRGRGAGGVAVHNGRVYYAGGLNNGAAVPWFDVYDPATDAWSQLPDMPRVRDHFHAVVVGGKFYAIGGRNAAINATTTANDAFDLSSGAWQTGLAPLPTARGGFAAAVLGSEILVIGGEGAGTTYSKVEAYNTTTNSWRTLAPMPTARHGIQAATCNGGVYIAAGGRTQGGANPTNIHEVFFLGSATACTSAGGTPTPTPTPTPTAGSGGFTTIGWSTVAPNPEQRGEAQGGVVNGKLYVMGGYAVWNPPQTHHIPTARSDVYDPATNTWSPLPNLPTAMTHSANAVAGNDLYLAGGYVNPTGTSSGEVAGTTAVWKFNVVTQAWTAMPSLPQARGSGGLVVHNGNLHFFGGNDTNRVDKGEHWVLALNGGTSWTPAAPLPNPRSHMGAVALGGKIYAVGGQHSYEHLSTTQSSVHEYDPATDTWTAVASLPTPLSHISSSTFAMDGRIIVIGGETSHGNVIANARAYDPATDTWTSLTSLPAARNSGVSGVINGVIYFSTGALTTTTYKGIPGGGTGPTPTAMPTTTGTATFTATPTPTTTASPTPGSAGADISLENLDVVPFPDRLIFSRIGSLASPPTTHGVHDRATLRIRNVGNAPLQVTGLTVSGPWAIEPAVATPATIAAGSQLDVTLRFRAESGDTHTGTLTIASNDADESSLVVQLAGFWQNVPENNQEPDLVEIVPILGYQTIIVGPGQQLANDGLVQTVGDEILSPYWQRADGSQLVSVYQVAAYHGANINGIFAWHPKGSSSTTTLMDSASTNNQTFLPRLTGAASTPPNVSFNPSSPVFGFKLDTEWSDPSLNNQTADQSLGCPGPCGHHVRVWPVKDRQGTVIPNTYLLAMDYQSINFDYQDTVYLITNVQPEGSGPTPTPSPTPTPDPNAIAKINFQTTTAPVPSGYTPDTGLGFAATRGFGWVQPGTSNPVNMSSGTRFRSTPEDLRLRTLAHMRLPGTSTEGAWEYVLPNGAYSVTVNVGDADFIDSTHRINVEGVRAINDFVPSATTKFASATVVVNVTDGKLTIDAIGGVNTKINYIDVSTDVGNPTTPTPTPTPTPTSTPTPTPDPGLDGRVNFQTAGAPVPSGYVADSGQAFDSTRGFGWVREDSLGSGSHVPLNISPNTRLRTTPGDQRLKTFVAMTFPPEIPNPTAVKTRAAWEYVLPNGTYSVFVSVGDNEFYDSTHQIHVEGVTAITGFNPSAADPFRSATVTVEVTDGRLTIDAIGGYNTKLNFVEIAGVPAGTQPSVTGTAPQHLATNVRRDTAINADVFLPNVGMGVDSATLTTANVWLYRTDTNALVPGTINTTGGGDAIVYQPNEMLAANANYTFRVSGRVTDESGASFTPFSMSFKTGNEPAVLDPPATFTKTVVFSTPEAISSVVISPDGAFLYASSLGGNLRRWPIDPETGTLGSVQTFSGLSGRAIIGMAFDPDNANVLWVSHNAPLFPEPAPDWTGKISKLTLGASGFNPSVVDFVVGLPRSAKDHLSNSLTFGPDGMLYLTQGSMSATGAPDSTWFNRSEHALSAAVLQINPQYGGPLPINVQTEGLPSNYNPNAPGAPVTVFGEGTRNAYDLVWHSNGRLYVPTNGSAAGGNTPASPSGVTPGITNAPTLNDFLFLVEDGGYYGHPNPHLENYALNGANPTSGVDPAEVVDQVVGGTVVRRGYPVGTAVDPDYRFFAWDFGRNRSPNGVIEYRSGTFGGSLQNKLLVVEYSGGDDILVLTPSSANGSIVEAEVLGVPAGLSNPLDLIEDPRNGNMYVVELVTFSSGGASGQISLLRPTP